MINSEKPKSLDEPLLAVLAVDGLSFDHTSVEGIQLSFFIGLCPRSIDCSGCNSLLNLYQVVVVHLFAANYPPVPETRVYFFPQLMSPCVYMLYNAEHYRQHQNHKKQYSQAKLADIKIH